MSDFDSHPAEQWTPVRYVHQDQRCDFCWRRIPRGVPGSRTGDRGTKAWFNPARGVWECMPCRSEATDCQFAREGQPWGA